MKNRPKNSEDKKGSSGELYFKVRKKKKTKPTEKNKALPCDIKFAPLDWKSGESKVINNKRIVILRPKKLLNNKVNKISVAVETIGGISQGIPRITPMAKINGCPKGYWENHFSFK